MALFKTHGVVVRRMDLGEADRLLTLFTLRFGKLKAVARGCRKAKSRLAGHLEPLQAAEFMLWRREGRELALIRGAEMLETTRALEGDFHAFAAGQFAAELIDRSLEPEEPQPRLYALLLQLLRALKRPDHVAPALLAFTVRATDLLGYALSLDRCAVCALPLAGQASGWLDYREGGLVCTGCQTSAGRHGEPVSREVVAALRSAAASPPRASGTEAANAGVRALDRLLGYHQDRRALVSERLLDVMELPV